MHDQALQGDAARSRPPRSATSRAGRAGRDVLVFSGALVIIALHAIVDSFIAPEPGTGASDHLMRGLVSLAVLALAVAVYPRLPAGGRAGLAGVFGALALEGAILAIADARAVGARDEDWTGFLLVPVGVVLLVQAALLLWRSRKPGRFRWIRRAGIALATIVLLYWTVVPIGIAILASSWGVLRDAVTVLLEQAPRGMDAADVGRRMATVPGVVEVHDLHIWTITSGFPALSAHVLVKPGADCHAIRRDLERMLVERFGLDHTTLQVDHLRGPSTPVEISPHITARRG